MRYCPPWAVRPRLNLAVELAEKGILEKYNVELIGAKLPAIKKGRGQGTVQKGDGEDRSGCAQERGSYQRERGAEG